MVASMPDAPQDRTPSPAEGTTETDLVRRLANGDTGAMEAFHKLTCRRAYGLACHTLGDPLRAQSVLHDVYVDAWRRMRRDCPAMGTEVSWILSLVFEHCPALSGRAGHPSPASPDATS